MRDFAERLIAYEAKANESTESTMPPAHPVIEHLRPHLAILMGDTGFRALLTRALARAEAEVPWLRAVQVKTDGTLQGFDGQPTQVDPKDAAAGSVALLAQLLALLATFIGPNMTLRLMREIWPAVPLSRSTFDKSDANGKTH